MDNRRFTLLLLLSLLCVFVTSTLTGDPAQDPYSCSASKPCKIGCCSKTGVCGLGPKFCGSDVCQSSCNAKSDCDPGWGAQWSNKPNCPLNVCCSQYGFCGTTSDFCGNKTVAKPSCSGTSATQRIIGYYEGWSSTRACRGMFPEDLLAGLYTHLNYAFAFVNPSTFEIAPMAELDKTLYPRFTALKQINPSLETWISVGGWSMNDPDQPTAKTFSQLAGSTANQNKFFASLVKFMSQYGFDGVDIDWEYPVAPERSGNPADFANYVSFLKNLKNALGAAGGKHGITLTLPSSYWYMQNFDIKSLEPYVDWFNVMSYDLHGTWDSTDPYIGSIVNAHTNLTEIDQTMDLLWRNQIDPAKVVMGTGFYGRSFTLANPSCKTAGCAFSAGGNPGPCSASAGTLMYSEIEDIIAAGATVTTDTAAAVKIVTWDTNQWVSYDDPTTLKQKLDYANGKCLGGLMVWAASTDDGSGSAIKSLSTAANRTVAQRSLFGNPKQPNGQCVWGECNAGCPSGFQPATGSGGKVSGFAGIFNGCASGQSRYFCCPTGAQLPKCTWKGSPKFCGLLSKNKCGSDEVEVTTTTVNPADGTSCWTGHMSLCCNQTPSDADIDKCRWYGSAPICTTAGILLSPGVFFTSADCPKDHPIKQTTGKYGSGGEQPCLYDAGFKSYCCKDPSPWKNCQWHEGSAWSFAGWAQSWIAGGLLHGALSPILGMACKGECAPNQIAIATDGTSCQPGTYSYYCCDNPNAPSLPTPQDVSNCPTPANIPGRNTNADPDGVAPRVFEESTEFDSDCVLHGMSSTSSKLRKRGLEPISWEELQAWELEDLQNTTSRDWRLDDQVTYLGNDGLVLGGVSDLELHTDGDYVLSPRGNLVKRTLDKGALLKFCAPGQPAVNMYPQTYSGFRTVAKLAGKGWITIAKPAVCGAFGVASFLTQPAGEDFVTEHVFEKQSLRDYIQYMTIGQLPDGSTLAAGKATVVGVFDAAGAFFNNWPSSASPGFGVSPVETAFGALGHAQSPANYDNLQVCDAALNAIKARITAGVAFISTTEFTQYGDQAKVSYLSDVVDTFSYIKFSATTKSYNLAYKGVITFWQTFAKLSTAQAGYDYVGAFKALVSNDLDHKQGIAQALFKTLLDQTTKIWKDPSMANSYTPGEIKANLDALADMSTNLAKYLSYDKIAMTS